MLVNGAMQLQELASWVLHFLFSFECSDGSVVHLGCWEWLVHWGKRVAERSCIFLLFWWNEVNPHPKEDPHLVQQNSEG